MLIDTFNRPFVPPKIAAEQGMKRTVSDTTGASAAESHLNRKKKRARSAPARDVGS